MKITTHRIRVKDEAGEELTPEVELMRYNPYVCRTCGGITLTAHTGRARDAVTPSNLGCRAKGEKVNPITGRGPCEGMASSGWYPDSLPDAVMGLEVWVWDVPHSNYEHAALSDAMKDHVGRGGAILREPTKQDDITKSKDS